MKKYDLSIIIPVFNVELYISECLNSILMHNTENVEIILVNDGSTDNSYEVCMEFEKKYDNIILYNKENGGAADARNYGIKNSHGKYLMFIDSDDFVINNQDFEKLLKLTKFDNDIIQFKMKYYYDNSGKYKSLNDLDECVNLKYVECLKSKVAKNELSISPCDKIIKSEIIINNEIYFEKGIVAEDIDWSLKVYLKANNIFTTNLNIYVYRQNRKGSVTNIRNSKLVESLYFVINKWYRFNYDNLEIKDVYLNYLAYQYLILITIINKKNCSLKLKKQIYSLREILNNNVNKKVKLTTKLISILGYNLGVQVLKLYLKIKDMGIIKL